MANDYAAMQTRIASEIEDDGFTAEIKLAILDAIKRHRSKRFWFNTVVGQSFAVATEYVAPSLIVSNIATTEPLTVVDLLTIDDGAGANYRAIPLVDNAYIDAAQYGSRTGRPQFCSLVTNSDGTRLRFYPSPDTSYTAKITGVIRYLDPVADADTSPWFVDAEMLIRQEAKEILATDQTNDADGALKARNAADRALVELRLETTRRTPAQPMRTEIAAMQVGARRFNITTGTYGGV